MALIPFIIAAAPASQDTLGIMQTLVYHGADLTVTAGKDIAAQVGLFLAPLRNTLDKAA